MRKVNDPAAAIGASVIYAHDNAFAIGLVGNAHLGAEWKRWMGSRKLRRGEALAVGSEAACEAII
jgi:hypothetical protein